MSFFLTTNQIRNRTKTVTRRFGWWFLRPGDVVCAVEKGMGLKKGEKVVELTTIRILSTRGERLDAITKEDCILEGFPELAPEDFVQMLVKHYGVSAEAIINRIEFEYI